MIWSPVSYHVTDAFATTSTRTDPTGTYSSSGNGTSTNNTPQAFDGVTIPSPPNFVSTNAQSLGGTPGQNGSSNTPRGAVPFNVGIQ